jgi:hypothetical protein
MKLTFAVLLIAPLLASIGTVAAVPSPVAELDDTVNGVKAKIDQLVGTRDFVELLEARAPVTGTVNGDAVRYRRCPNTSPACEPVGQYNRGQRITIICRAIGETVNGWR